MTEKCTHARGTQCKHTSDEVIMYMDFTEYLEFTSSTIASVSSVACTDDATLVFAGAAVIGSNTTVPWLNEEHQVVQGTIAANKGVQVTVSGGAAQEADADPNGVVFTVVLSTGEVVARVGRLRVEG